MPIRLFTTFSDEPFIVEAGQGEDAEGGTLRELLRKGPDQWVRVASKPATWIRVGTVIRIESTDAEADATRP